MVTIPISHYCEKARWALDRAGIEFIEDAHVQVLHVWAAWRAGRQRTVPVLKLPHKSLGESTEIVRWTDPTLFGEGAQQRKCERLVASYDAFGVHTRLLVYDRVLPSRAVVSRYNPTGVPAWERLVSRPALPVLSRFLRRHLKIGPESVSAALEAVSRVLDDVSDRLADGRPYLMGDRFTAADLTFACMAAPLVLPPDYGVPLPRPDELEAGAAIEFRTFRRHPAGAFALRMFREERPAPTR